jgi:hypothetical protein
VVVTVVLVAACSAEEPPPPPTALEIVVAPPTSIANRGEFSVAPVIQLVDAAGEPAKVAGVSITAVVSGSGVILAGSTMAATDTDGKAAFPGLSTMGSTGSYQLTFTSPGIGSISAPIMITAGQPASIAASGSWPEVYRYAPRLLAILASPQVIVRDADGNPVPSATVTFAIGSGGGTIANPEQQTDVSGRATAGTWTLGASAGANTLVASVANVTLATPFSATAVNPVGSVAAGFAISCGISTAGRAYCWGNNAFGGIGNGTQQSTNVATSITDAPYFARISTGVYNTCGVAYEGSAYCWGPNEFGEVGDGTTTMRTRPTAVATALRFAEVVTGRQATCGITTAGAAYCWGRNTGGIGASSQPTAVNIPQVFTDIEISGGFACAITTSGAIYCWGANNAAYVPKVVSGTIAFARMQPGARHCGVSTSGVGYCWPILENETPPPTPVSFPDNPTMATVTSSSLDGQVCFLTTTGVAYCFGSNASGQLGDGTTTLRESPVLVSGGLTFTAIATGDAHTCALRAAGGFYCWGANSVGQLGTGNLTQSLVPVPVVIP